MNSIHAHPFSQIPINTTRAQQRTPQFKHSLLNRNKKYSASRDAHLFKPDLPLIKRHSKHIFKSHQTKTNLVIFAQNNSRTHLHKIKPQFHSILSKRSDIEFNSTNHNHHAFKETNHPSSIYWLPRSVSPPSTPLPPLAQRILPQLQLLQLPLQHPLALALLPSTPPPPSKGKHSKNYGEKNAFETKNEPKVREVSRFWLHDSCNLILSWCKSFLGWDLSTLKRCRPFWGVGCFCLAILTLCYGGQILFFEELPNKVHQLLRVFPCF